MIFVISLLVIHVEICIFITLAYKRERGLHGEAILPIVYAVPVFGALCFLMRIWIEEKRHLGEKDIAHDFSDVMKGRYQKIEVEENSDMQVVPLEEALLVNDAKVRHSMMLNILHKNPNEYIGMLQRASNSDDMEVTHYATTMMMEIMTEYEKKLQEYEKLYQKNPADQKMLREYILYLNEFIHSKLATGNIERIHRKNLAKLLEEYLSGREQAGKLIFISIENYLLLEENERAQELLEQAKKEYSDDERVYRLYGHYFHSIRDYESIQKMVSYIKEHNIYLSHEGRDWLTFWS